MAVISKDLKRALAATVADVRALGRFLSTQPPAVTVYGTHRESQKAAVTQGHMIGGAIAKRGAAVRTGAATAVMHSAPAGFNAERATHPSSSTHEPQGVFLRGLPTEKSLSAAIASANLTKMNTFRFRELGLMLDGVTPGAVVPGSIITRDGGLSTLSELVHEISWMQHGGPRKGLALDPQWQPMVQALYAGANSAIGDSVRYSADPAEMAAIALEGPVCRRGVDVDELLRGIEAELISGFTALADDRAPPIVITGPRGGSDAATNALLRDVASTVAKRGGDLRLGMGGPILDAVRKGVQGSDAKVRLFLDRNDAAVAPDHCEVHAFDWKPAQQHTLLHGLKALVVVWPGDADTVANVFHFITEVRKHRRPAVPVVICGDIEGAKKAWQMLADLREERLGSGLVDKDQLSDSFYNVLFSNNPEEIAKTIYDENSYYAKAYSRRVDVPAHLVAWDTPHPSYAPPRIFAVKPGAEPTPPELSAPHTYQRYSGAQIRFDATQMPPLPLHPQGRRGVAGPGAGGAFGPKLSVDSIIVRNHPHKGPQVLLIKRGDTGAWALPGGKREAKGNNALEATASAMRRKTSEEAGITLPLSAYSKGSVIFEGLTNDPRDTDNFWIETQARLVVVPWTQAKHLKPAGSMSAAAWKPLAEALQLVSHGNHREILAKAAQTLHSARSGKGR